MVHYLTMIHNDETKWSLWDDQTKFGTAKDAWKGCVRIAQERLSIFKYFFIFIRLIAKEKWQMAWRCFDIYAILG